MNQQQTQSKHIYDHTSQNRLRAVHFDRPDYIPMTWHTNNACWNHYTQEQLEELMVTHPLLFPEYQSLPENYVPTFSPWTRKDEPYRDDWGCLWETSQDGISGSVTQHPLADWSNLDSYTPPNSERSNGLISVDWNAISAECSEQKKRGQLPCYSLVHGHTFLLLTYLRGYENVIFDMMDQEPRLHALIETIEEFNADFVNRLINTGFRWIGYPEDLGMQQGPMLPVDQFRQYIKPVYQRMMQPAREAGCIVHMHSDGDIRTLAEDLIEGGVEVLNLQDLVNGIDWIRDNLKGKVCIDLDIDRQKITARGTPRQIDTLIRNEVETLGSSEGGLMMIYDLYPNTPFENVIAVADAMERYATYYS